MKKLIITGLLTAMFLAIPVAAFAHHPAHDTISGSHWDPCISDCFDCGDWHHHDCSPCYDPCPDPCSDPCPDPCADPCDPCGDPCDPCHFHYSCRDLARDTLSGSNWYLHPTNPCWDYYYEHPDDSGSQHGSDCDHAWPELHWESGHNWHWGDCHSGCH